MFHAMSWGMPYCAPAMGSRLVMPGQKVDGESLHRLFEENGVTTVVDFKTDHELAAGESRYRAQVQQYVGAVERATGRRARGILFKV